MQTVDIEIIKEVVDAWEKLPMGHYKPEIITEWLAHDMSPVINKLREIIKNEDKKSRSIAGSDTDSQKYT